MSLERRKAIAIAVLTHERPAETGPALHRLIGEAVGAGAELFFDQGETLKHGLEAVAGVRVNASIEEPVDVCVVLGGDGTILRALRLYSGREVPVFAINFGAIGFLASIEPEDLEEGLRRALTGEYELLRLPAILLEDPQGAGEQGLTGSERAFNDIAIHRKVGERVAELAYAINGEVLGSVRCDGLVVATPAGSTGYNLANGGPVMAWGVEGFVVSFIAPHSLTARALVVAPTDRLTVENRSRDTIDVSMDGRPVREIAPGGMIDARFIHDVGTIAQLPGSSFYLRLQEKFGRLAR